MPARTRLALGWYQVLGGLAGMLSAGLLAAKGSVGLRQGLTLVAAAAFFMGLGLAGALLLRGHGWAKPLSLAVQGLQIPKLFTSLFVYELYSPLTATVELRPARWSLGVGLEVGGGFNLGIGADPVVAVLGVNVVATAVLWLLLHSPAIPGLPPTVRERERPA